MSSARPTVPPAQRPAAAAVAVARVSRSCACIGSPCLRHCVHGASVGGSKGGGGGGRRRWRLAGRAAMMATIAPAPAKLATLYCQGGDGGSTQPEPPGRSSGVTRGSDQQQPWSISACIAAFGGVTAATLTDGGDGDHGGGGGKGESFLRVDWVAVPQALRARRVNRGRQRRRRRQRPVAAPCSREAAG
jgi:hypothetical protein